MRLKKRMLAETLQTSKTKLYRVKHNKAHEEWSAMFKVGDNEYQASAANDPFAAGPEGNRRLDSWEFFFHCATTGECGRTGIGDHFEVLAAASGALLEFMRSVKPDHVDFSVPGDDKRRAQVYDRIAKKLAAEAKKLGYDLKSDGGYFISINKKRGI